MKTKTEVVVRRLAGRKADLCELSQRYQVLPPGATLAGLKGSGHDTLPWAPAQGAGVGWGRGALQRTDGACPALHPFPLLLPPGNNTLIFLWGTPSPQLSLHDYRHLYVTSSYNKEHTYYNKDSVQLKKKKNFK